MSFELFHTIQGLILAAGGTLMVLIAIVMWRLKPRPAVPRPGHFGGGRSAGAGRAARDGRLLSRRLRRGTGAVEPARRGRKRIAMSPAALLAVMVGASALVPSGRLACAPMLDGRAKKCVRFLGHRMVHRIGLHALEEGRLDWAGRRRVRIGS